MATRRGANTKNKHSRIAELDYLRGAAILAVIGIHTFGIYSADNFYRNLPLLFVNIGFANFFGFAVPVFIIISGFALYNFTSRTVTLASFYRARFSRIIPAYVLFSFLYSVIGGTTSLPLILWQFATGTAYFHLWFIPLIIQLYLLYPLFDGTFRFFAERKKDTTLVLCILLVQIAWSAVSLSLNNRSVADAMNLLFLTHIFYFFLGMYAAAHFDEIKKKISSASLPALITGVAASIIPLSSLTFFQVFNVLQHNDALRQFQMLRAPIMPVYTVLILILLVRVIAYYEKKGRSLVFLKTAGDNSYGIYLIHALFLSSFSALLKSVYFSGSSTLFNPVLAVLVLAASFVTVRGVGKIPYLSLAVGSATRKSTS